MRASLRLCGRELAASKISASACSPAFDGQFLLSSASNAEAVRRGLAAGTLILWGAVGVGIFPALDLRSRSKFIAHPDSHADALIV